MCANEKYEELMLGACEKAVSDGIEGIAFGDLFLEDVRVYRERQLKGRGWSRYSPCGASPLMNWRAR
jgi:hypothetical protein